MTAPKPAGPGLPRAPPSQWAWMKPDGVCGGARGRGASGQFMLGGRDGFLFMRLDVSRDVRHSARADSGSSPALYSGVMAKAKELGGLGRLIEGNGRVTVRREGEPDPAGKCVVYWMQRAQRGMDNHALNLAVEVANELELPLLVYFAGISNFSQREPATLRVSAGGAAGRGRRSGGAGISRS